MKKDNRTKYGFIIGLMFALCEYFAGIFRSGTIHRILSSSERDDKLLHTSAIAAFFRSLWNSCRKYIEAIKKFIARQFERSFMLRSISSAVSRLISLPGRVIGAFAMTWGAYAVLIYLIKKYASINSSVSSSDLITGFIVVVSSLPLMFTDKSLGRLCNESPFVFSMLTKIFGVPFENIRSGVSRKAGQSGAVILGIIAGLLTYFIPPLDMVIGAVALVIVMLIFAYPEGGVVISIAISPFLGLTSAPSVTLAAVVILTAMSYLIKVLRGKRVFRIGVTEFAVYAFMIAVFLSGFAPGGSNTFENALLCCSLMLIFPLMVNLMRYRQWITTCAVAFILPSGLVAAIGIAQYLLGAAPSGWVDSTLFSGITSRAVSLFNNPNILGVYLVALFPMTLMLTLPRYSKKIRILGGIVSCYIAVSVIFTFSRSAWLALAAGAMIFAVLVTPKGILWLIPITAVIAVVALLFPDTVGARLLNFVSLTDSANNYRVAVWNSSWELLSDSFMFGIGWGEEAFRTAYINYGADGTQYAMHSHSLFMQIAIQTGLVGFLLFVMSVLSVASKCIRAFYRSRTDESLSLIARAAITGAVAIMIAGVFDYTWYNFRIFFVFWALLGLACAAMNVSDREKEQTVYLEIDEFSSFVSVPIPKLNLNDSDFETNKEEMINE